MATNQEIVEKIADVLTESYERVKIGYIPKKNHLTFGNTVAEIEHAKVFYIDMRKSRQILTDATDFWSAKIHKAFLTAVTRCIENREGHLRSFNGDGILAFFIGDNAASRAVRAAMEIKGFVNHINEILIGESKKAIDFGIGIGQGPIMVVKSGKSGDDQTKQDLVWIGVALYVAVELSEMAQSPKNIWISKNVRDAIGSENTLDVVSDGKGKSIWEKQTATLKSVGYCEPRSTTWYFNV